MVVALRHDGSVPRVLLVLPTATYRARDFTAAARALGAEVVIATDTKLAISGLAEDACVVVDPARPQEAAEAIARYHREHPLDTVLGVDEQGVLAAATAAERLGLRHNPPGAVATTRDKAAMREALRARGVAQPSYRIAPAGSSVPALAGEVGWPCVIKPVSLSASRGVIRVDDPTSAGRAAERIRAILGESGREGEALLVERYVDGLEVVVEGLLRDGRLDVLAVLDKPDPPDGPYFEETLFVTPSRLPRAAIEEVRRVSEHATSALGLTEGPIHAELRVSGGRALVLEVAARSIGGLCSRSLRFGSDMTLEEVILRHGLGQPLEGIAREKKASGVMMIPIPRAGILRGVHGQAAALALPEVESVEVTIGKTRAVRPLPEGDRYLGFIFARADTAEEVESALRAAHARLVIEIDDADPGAVHHGAPPRREEGTTRGWIPRSAPAP